MIAVDTNILVYAHRPETPRHLEARRALEVLATGPAAWAIPMHCLVEFTGVVTNPRIWHAPSSSAACFEQVRAWREAPKLTLLDETEAFWPRFVDVVTRSRARGGGVHDARIVACCLAHGVDELWTCDRDFSSYPALKVRNPLVE